MKKAVVLFTLCLFTAFVVSSTFAAEPPAKEPVKTVIGTVNVVKDANGVVKEIMLHTAMVKYNIVLDEKGKELAALDGKKVKATGVVEVKGKAEWLKVHKFEEVTAEPPKPKAPTKK
ncbi:MAG: hypothetical protein ABSE89_05735 [Sedimentisphaerales bacterium]